MIGRLKNLHRVGAVLLIIAATLLVYWPAQFNGFVWDDTALVLRDPLIRSWRLIPESFRHFLFLDATASDFYRPLQRLTFIADYAMWEFFPKGYHLTNIYLHIGAAVALFFLAERWLGKHRRAWAIVIALVWAVHPLHTSAVTYVSGRADPLAALFGFAALTFGLATFAPGAPARLTIAGAGLCFLGALLSKESGVFALLVWIAVLAVQRVRREEWLRWGAVMLVVLAMYSALRFSAEKIAPPSGRKTSLGVRQTLVARAAAEYAELLIAPHTLRMERDITPGKQNAARAGAARATVIAWQTWLGAAVLALLAAWWWWARRRAPGAALALVAAAIAYVPISNVFALNATAAEHWLYVPSAFLFLAVAASLRGSAGDSPAAVGDPPNATEQAAPALTLTNANGPQAFPEPARRVAAQHRRVACATRDFAAIAVLAIWTVWLGSLTWHRQADWKDQPTFFQQTIAHGGDTARMHINLGTFEAARGNDEAARERFREALRLDPQQPIAMLGLAAESIRLGDYPTAREALDRAAKFRHVAAEVAQLRGALDYRETGSDATPAMKAASEAMPLNWHFRKRYLTALTQTGKSELALRELRTLLAEQPFRSDSWKMLGDLLSRARQPAAAARAFSEAARLDVHDIESAERARILAQIAGSPATGGP